MALFKSKPQEISLTPQQEDPLFPAEGTVKTVSSMMDQDSVSKTKSSKVTFIAQNSKLQGEITLEGDIHIDGCIEGKIESNGTITVMLNGQITGELRAPAITINGKVNGLCDASTVEILEKGRVEGTIRSSAFSVSKGGIFIGTSEQLDEGELLPAPRAKSKLTEDLQVAAKKENKLWRRTPAPALLLKTHKGLSA